MHRAPSPRNPAPEASPRRCSPGRGAFSTLLVLAAVLGAAGCATKGDLKDLRQEVRKRAAAQDSALAEIRALASRTLDSVRAHREEFVAFRGDFGRQLLAIEDQLVEIQELTGQSQRGLAELRDEMEARRRRLVRPPRGTPGDTAGGGETGQEGPAGEAGARPSGSGTDAETLYNAALKQLNRGSVTTARRGFQEFLRAHSDHALAPDARFYLAETLERENRLEEALEGFLRIPELHPASDRVPDALYRAGLIEEQRGDTDAAAGHFRRVVDGYPDSDAAVLARRRLEEIG